MTEDVDNALQKPASAGRTVFEYELANAALCDAFLKRHGAPQAARQAELFGLN